MEQESSARTTSSPLATPDQTSSASSAPPPDLPPRTCCETGRNGQAVCSCQLAEGLSLYSQCTDPAAAASYMSAFAATHPSLYPPIVSNLRLFSQCPFAARLSDATLVSSRDRVTLILKTQREIHGPQDSFRRPHVTHSTPASTTFTATDSREWISTAPAAKTRHVKLPAFLKPGWMNIGRILTPPKERRSC